jgi:hypothetical protein
MGKSTKQKRFEKTVNNLKGNPDTKDSKSPLYKRIKRNYLGVGSDNSYVNTEFDYIDVVKPKITLSERGRRIYDRCKAGVTGIKNICVNSFTNKKKRNSISESSERTEEDDESDHMSCVDEDLHQIDIQLGTFEYKYVYLKN